MRRMKSIMTGAVAMLAMRAEPLLACSVCYGQSDSPMAQGMNWGILSLLGVVAGVLAGISLFFVHVGRRSGMTASGAGLAAEMPEKKI